ncbi:MULTISPECIES: flagellar export chaperone FliS [Pantoea]|uniref:Flagellar secretion chaperone FliS n=1 Tax=Pantoea endophytica TaxID=92488 RepID=A0ABX4SL73_9GAMM|nr:MULTISPECIES: flagellar export chaperone FliS [Pantoea]PLR20444.1 flagellar protein FliS [Pantoea endophytica]
MYNQSGANAYARVGLESSVMSASQEQLMTMLFEGALSALIRARLFMQDGNIEGKGNALAKAGNIIENGLRLSLPKEGSDELSDNLIALYAYMQRRIVHANRHNDVEAIEEVETLLRNIADAWKQSLEIATAERETG